MSNYPDIPQDESNLCWAASLSNALYFTGWNALFGVADEQDLYNMLKNLPDGQANRQSLPIKAVRQLLVKKCLSESLSSSIIKQHPPYDMPLLKQVFNSGGCGIIGVRNYSSGHALTAYDADYNNNYQQCDPRHITRLYCADSYDNQTAIVGMTVEYKPEYRKYAIEYPLGNQQLSSAVVAWYSIQKYGPIIP